MKLERGLLREQTEEETEDAAGHIAWLARTLVAMGPEVATSMSATQRVAPSELEAIRRLLPSLAARHGLRARLEEENGSVTVTFERTPR